MTRLKLALVAAIVVVAVTAGVAEASNTTAARQRMTAQLFAERGSELSYKAGNDPASGLVFLEVIEGAEGMYQSWRPAWVRVSCRGARCTGRLFVNNESEPVGETYVALVDHATFRGRKGTYHETGWEPLS